MAHTLDVCADSRTEFTLIHNQSALSGGHIWLYCHIDKAGGMWYNKEKGTATPLLLSESEDAMKAQITKLELTRFYDLSGKLIAHMCYWTIYYNTGKTNKKVGVDNRVLPDTAKNFYERATATHTVKGFYAESAYTETTTYRMRVF